MAIRRSSVKITTHRSGKGVRVKVRTQIGNKVTTKTKTYR